MPRFTKSCYCPVEVLIVYGKSAAVSQFADRLIGLKGVQHGRLVMIVPAWAIEAAAKSKQKYGHKRIQKP